MSTLDDPKAPISIGRMIKRLENIKRESPTTDTPEAQSIRELNAFCDELITILRAIKENGFYATTRSATKFSI